MSEKKEIIDIEEQAYESEYMLEKGAREIIQDNVLMLSPQGSYEPPLYTTPLQQYASQVIKGIFNTRHFMGEDAMPARGLRPGGKLAIVMGTGARGRAVLEYLVRIEPKVRPKLVVVTGVDRYAIADTRMLFSIERMASLGMELHYVNTSRRNGIRYMNDLSGQTGYDDVLVMTRKYAHLENAVGLLAKNSCLNLFVAPEPDGRAAIHMYKLYEQNAMLVYAPEARLNCEGRGELCLPVGYNPAVLVSHIGGKRATEWLTDGDDEGGIKLLYEDAELPLTSIGDLEVLEYRGEPYMHLAKCCAINGNCWNAEAERFLLDFLAGIRRQYV